MGEKRAMREEPGARKPGRERPLRRVEARPPLVEQAVDRLRAWIIDGHLPADREIPPESALCRTLGVSRTVVREAMRILRAQGLVEVSQGKRPRVRPADAKFAIDSLALMLRRGEASLLHLAELRRPMESEIAALAAARATPSQIQRLDAAIQELAAAPDLAAQADADLRFHFILAEASGNPLFQLVLEAIWGLQRQSRMTTIAHSRAVTAITWHRRILEAVRANDSAAAHAQMTGHIDASRQDLLESGATDGKPPRPGKNFG
ncbi:MAG TPA: FCD domain-containing protein [Tepidisphaeraceae bacterium]|jgi:GntR family transcriptional repressor for pyruvate dehydrogenase complex|nr:FCD domain-containing protein [Tepidisphaeraceae bacterium]